MEINIDGAWHQADEKVVQRMTLYYEAIKKLSDDRDKLWTLVNKMRALQRRYFTERTPDLLRACKMAEKELDDYLTGKNKPEQQLQAELFK